MRRLARQRVDQPDRLGQLPLAVCLAAEAEGDVACRRGDGDGGGALPLRDVVALAHDLAVEGGRVGVLLGGVLVERRVAVGRESPPARLVLGPCLVPRRLLHVEVLAVEDADEIVYLIPEGGQLLRRLDGLEFFLGHHRQLALAAFKPAVVDRLLGRLLLGKLPCKSLRSEVGERVVDAHQRAPSKAAPSGQSEAKGGSRQRYGIEAQRNGGKVGCAGQKGENFRGADDAVDGDDGADRSERVDWRRRRVGRAGEGRASERESCREAGWLAQ
mmetsp:Transcript_90/g.312  ORF Transcript_90/g.312 Transcript_90/m.312 type:complete len:272 (-) Transcript_90:78-893(-)